MRWIGMGLVGVAACAVLWLWMSSDRRDLTLTLTSADGERARAERASVVESLDPDSVANRDETVDRAEQLGAQEGVGVAVRTIDARTGEPVAGATVRFLPPAFDAAALEAAREVHGTDSDALFAEHAHAITTDGDGRGVVHPSPADPVFLATAGPLYGVGGVWGPLEEAGERVIEMAFDWTFSVRVVGPAGSPVEGAIVWAEPATREPGRSAMPDWLGTSDGEGLATVRHAQRKPVFEKGPALLQALGPGATGPAVRVDPADVPDEIELSLPATGVVVVQVTTADGAPFDPKYFEGEGLRVELDPVEGHFDKPISYQRSLSAEGTARFLGVAVGRRLRVGIEHFGAFESVEFDGPAEADQVVEVVLPEAEDAIVVTGRLVRSDGEPLSAMAVGLSLEDSVGQERLRTDGEGHFYWRPVPFGFEPDETVALWLGPAEVTPTSDLWCVRVAPRVLRPGEHDLGTLVAEPARRIATGRLEGVAAIDPASMRVELDCRERDGVGWRDLHAARVEFERDGTFQIDGVADAVDELRIGVQSQDFEAADPVSFSPGVHDLRIPVRATSQVEVGFAMDSARVWDVLGVQLEPSGGRRGRTLRAVGWRIHADDHATASFLRVPAGLWDLVVEHRRAGKELLRVEGVRVATGADPDPRLERIDLRSPLKTVWIRATTADGEPVVDGGTVLVEREDGELWKARIHGGAAPVVLAEPTPAWLAVPDHLLVRFDALFEDRDVQLRRAPRVAVRLLLPQALPEGVSAGARLSLRSLSSVVGEVDRSGLGRLPVVMPGKHVLTAWLRRGRRSEQVVRTEVELDPARLPAELPVEIDAEGFATALARLARGR